uniref:S1-like domain-containing protein n=1 Tax=viral metagenome TaxID=1070528 RepID=A0A6C0EBH8_9ZZZZ
MPNTRGGKGYKSGKKNTKLKKEQDFHFDKDDGIHHYATVLSRLGGSQFKVKMDNDETVTAILPGRMNKKVWCNKGDIVIVSYDKDNGCEIVAKVVKQEQQQEATASMIKCEGDDYDVFAVDKDDREEKLAELANEIKNIRSQNVTKDDIERKQRDKERSIRKKEREFIQYTDGGKRVVNDDIKKKDESDKESDEEIEKQSDEINIDDI